MSTLKVNNIDTQTGSNIVVASGKVLSAAGHIIQVVRNIPTTTSSVTLASSTMAELDTSYRTTITPKFSSSLLRLNFNGLISGQNTSAIMTFKFFDVTNSSNVGFSTLGTGSSRTFGNASFRNKDHDANDRVHLNMTTYQSASNTTARTYGIYAQIEGSNTIYANMTTTDNAGCSYVAPVFTIEEIAQ